MILPEEGALWQAVDVKNTVFAVNLAIIRAIGV
jgi:hypothetical protein